MKAIGNDDILAVVAKVRECGGQRAAARALGKCLKWVQYRVAAAKERGLDSDPRPVIDVEPVVRGRVHATPRTEWALPPKGQVKRYIFTCAQSNTHLFAPGWESLRALAEYYDARICVSTFTYDLAAYGASSVKRGKAKGAKGEPWYAPEVQDFILDEPVVVAPGLVWCGEMNILPTAVRPLSGLESYSGRKSGIFPHVKFAMESVASGKYEGTKFNYTTGTVTQRNYIAKKAGQKAEFHHGYGALLAEVDSEGNWFCRQLNSDSDGVIHDLTLKAEGGRVTDGNRVEAVTWGDIHVGTVPEIVMKMFWGDGGMMDALQPRYQFMHDILDFRARNHHDRSNPHRQFEKFINGQDDVVDELKQVARFLAPTGPCQPATMSWREWCETVVVDSNHDNAMARWLREADYRADPKNALLFLQAQTTVYEAIAARRDFHLVEWAMRRLMRRPGAVQGPKNIRFLRPDESFIICRDANGGVECGWHGDHGPNGARGSLAQFARMGRKSNTGHGHAAGIQDGGYRSGITGDLDQLYNVGPSSWSRSAIVTYANGKRCIQTSWQGKWRA